MAPVLLAMAAALAPAPALPAPTVPDAVLATMRGGFRLPSGIDVSLAVQTDTAVNGALLLRSVFTAAEGRPSLEVLTPEAGRIVSIAKQGSATGGEGSTNVSVQFDPRSGIVATPGAGGTGAGLSIGGNVAAAAADAIAPGLQVVDAATGGAAVETPAGAVSVSALSEGTRVRLEGAGIDVSHIVGNAFGTVLANNANDRVIDTSTTISLDLRNAGPDVLGSAMFRVEGVAVDAARLSVR